MVKRKLTPEEIRNSNHEMVHDVSKGVGFIIVLVVGLVIISGLGPGGIVVGLFVAGFCVIGHHIYRWLKHKFKHKF